MFGYVRAYKPQLRFAEYDVYKAIYCSLCRRQGEEYGFLAKSALSYDVQFLALFSAALAERFDGIEKKRCRVNPLKKCDYCKRSQSDIFDYPAAVAMVLTYYKLTDNVNDEKGIKRLLYKLFRSFFSGKHRKAAARYPQLEAVCEAYYKRQCETEKSGNATIDTAAEPTAVALSEIFAECDEKQNSELKRFGYNLGKWIYLIDAGADYYDDLKSGSFNPLTAYRGEMTDAEIFDNILCPNLNICASVCAECLEEIKLNRFRPIIENVIFFGMENSYKFVKKEKMNEKSV